MLDGWLYYQDPSLPQFSSLTYLYVVILLGAAIVACDLGKLRDRKSGVAIQTQKHKGFRNTVKPAKGRMAGNVEFKTVSSCH
jgi:hypothetical protein